VQQAVAVIDLAADHLMIHAQIAQRQRVAAAVLGEDLR